jgi:phosphatidylglycerophosphate synthase
MNKIPILLIYGRLLMGLCILAASVAHITHFAAIAITLFTIGLISDILDGIIARRLNVSTVKLRRLDSAIDQVFWCLVIIASFFENPSFFKDNRFQLGILLAAEVLIYVISYAKFRKEVATHAISSKLWTLILFATVVQLLAIGDSGLLFQLCFYTGILTRLEIVAILLLLRHWTNDVPSVFHALRLRQGKPIRRNKFFNG